MIQSSPQFFAAVQEFFEEKNLESLSDESERRDVLSRYAEQLHKAPVNNPALDGASEHRGVDSTAHVTTADLWSTFFPGQPALPGMSGMYPILSVSGAARQHSVETLCRHAVAADAALIQLRAKELADAQFYAVAMRLQSIAKSRFIVNDRAGIAAALSCGLHVGLDDLPVSAARGLLGQDAVLGASSNTPADFTRRSTQTTYCAIGPLYHSQTKSGHAETTGLNVLSNIIPTSSVPVCVIGGIDDGEKVYQSACAGADLVAMVSAFSDATHPAFTLGYFNVAYLCGRHAYQTRVS